MKGNKIIKERLNENMVLPVVDINAQNVEALAMVGNFKYKC